MPAKAVLYQQIKKVEARAAASKLQRFFRTPFNYLSAITFRHLLARWVPRGWKRRATTCWGQPFLVRLPAGMDILLTGGKTDPTEIRLALFMVQRLEPGMVFVDVGSHFGFFTLLAHQCISQNGMIFSIEPSPDNFEILRENTELFSKIRLFQAAAGSEAGRVQLSLFPPRYSEYNTIFPQQFRNTHWFQKQGGKTVWVDVLTLDEILAAQKGSIFIKIDAEGAEASVVRGAAMTLAKQEVIVVMEYLQPSRHNEAHREAHAFLAGLGYHAFSIRTDGSLQACANIEQHLEQEKLESDNIVYIRSRASVS